MKIINIHNKQKELIKRASQNNREAQQLIFDEHAPKMLSICRMYVKDLHHAEELMLSGFLTVFTKLKDFHHQGSFEGWIRKIMVNTCLSYLRKKNLEFVTDDTSVFEKHSTTITPQENVEYLQILIDNLPDGYKLVFNLYAIEGYKHSEIAEKLNISENTSKSQLHKARKWLQKNYTNRKTSNYGVE